jgi:hypothetical protein
VSPETIAQAGAVLDTFIAAVKELQEGMAQGVKLLEGFRAQIDQAAAAQITAGKGKKTYGHDAN